MLEENTGTQTRVRLSAERKSTFRRRFGPDIAVSAISAFSLKARTPRYRSRFIARNWTRTPIGSQPTPFRRISRSDFTEEEREGVRILLDFGQIPWFHAKACDMHLLLHF